MTNLSIHRRYYIIPILFLVIPTLSFCMENPRQNGPWETLGNFVVFKQSECKREPTLFEAVESGNIEEVKRLLEQPRDEGALKKFLNAGDGIQTPIFSAVMGGQEEILEKLISYRNRRGHPLINVNKPDSKHGVLPLNSAIQNTRLGIVKILVEKAEAKIDIKSPNMEVASPLVQAIRAAKNHPADQTAQRIMVYLIDKIE